MVMQVELLDCNLDHAVSEIFWYAITSSRERESLTSGGEAAITATEYCLVLPLTQRLRVKRHVLTEC